MESRRSILKMLALGGALFASEAGATASALASVGEGSRLPDGPEPWWLIAPLESGSRLARGWRVHSLSRVEQGASVLELRNTNGNVARIHVCFRQGKAKGLAHTRMFDLLLMDGGNGDRSTDEHLARVLKDVARRIRSNEVRKDGDMRPMSRMLTHNERVDAYGPENLN